MKFRPLHDRVLVKRLEQEEKTAGGIIIPDTAQENPAKVKSSPLVLASAVKTAHLSPLTSKLATRCCSANGPAPKFLLTGKTC